MIKLYAGVELLVPVNGSGFRCWKQENRIKKKAYGATLKWDDIMSMLRGSKVDEKTEKSQQRDLKTPERILGISLQSIGGSGHKSSRETEGRQDLNLIFCQLRIINKPVMCWSVSNAQTATKPPKGAKLNLNYRRVH